MSEVVILMLTYSFTKYRWILL